jgi:hypothetical protein
VADEPLVIAEGAIVSAIKVGPEGGGVTTGAGTTVTVASRLKPLKVAVTVTVMALVTPAEACPWKLPVDWPAGTTKLRGTAKGTPSSVERLTAVPPEGAAAVKAMVTVADAPLLTVDGLIAIDASAGGGIVTVTDAVRVVPL